MENLSTHITTREENKPDVYANSAACLGEMKRGFCRGETKAAPGGSGIKLSNYSPIGRGGRAACCAHA